MNFLTAPGSPRSEGMQTYLDIDGLRIDVSRESSLPSPAVREHLHVGIRHPILL